MKWYFALSAASIDSPGHDWRSLIRVAVLSAINNTSLRPHLLWDGPEHPFLDEMRDRGVAIIFRHVSFLADLAAYNPDPAYLATASGCFLRVEIPLIEQEDEFVLYTDADVMFLSDPVPILKQSKPRYFAAAPEFTLDDELNSGVLLLNVKQMRQDYPAFVAFIRGHPQLGLDQDMFRHHYRDLYEPLDKNLNWKPYWGACPDAAILHWHGIKPVEARRRIADVAYPIYPQLAVLIERDEPAYRKYLNLYQRYLELYGVSYFRRMICQSYFGTILAYQFTDGAFIHRAPGDLRYTDFVVWYRFDETPCLFSSDHYGNERKLDGAWLDGFEAVGHASGDGSICLRRGDGFLTALPDGRFATDRSIASDWEIFLPVEVEKFQSTVVEPARPMAQFAKTCAVVLFVKNEASDIAAWLAWYHGLGFDACIVFDDDSDDETRDIVKRASLAQDIRLHDAKGPKPGPYEHRQDASYRFALAQYRREFEWLAFFDADEFLLLNQDDDIKSFLRRFPAADAVAVNWCNYGSGGHLLKPALLAPEAYTWHGDERKSINRHVKSIVRPDRVGNQWKNVHCFDVRPDRYVLSNGATVQWSETEGITDSNPDWSVAKLMHYQCRSMEHFVERLKKRPDLAGIRGIWHAYDLRDAQDLSPLRFADRLRARIAAITGATGQCRVIFDIGMSEGNDSAFYLAKGFEVVGVEADAAMYVALQDRFQAEIKSGALTLYNFAAAETAGNIVEFFHHSDHQGISGLEHARAEFASGRYQTYHVLTLDWSFLVAKHGVPHYVKIDIEGQEAGFLRGLAPDANLPTYISVECHSLEPVAGLHALGYRLFKLVDQNPQDGFMLANPQREGQSIAWEAWQHTSGPFGADLAGDWIDFEAFKAAWHAAAPEYCRTWFDCHAWRP